MLKRFSATSSGAAALVILLLCACTTGREFAKPSPESLVLGTTTRADVERVYGVPYKQGSSIVEASSTTSAATPPGPFDAASVSGSFAVLLYFYADRTATVIIGGSPTAKTVVFNFWNDKLIGYNFISSFTADSTNFDDSRVSSLEKGKTAKGDVVQMLGVPTGRAVYPFVQSQGEEKFLYVYVAVDSRSHERMIKRLEVLFDASDHLREYRFASDTSPLPVPTGGGGAVPIFIPHGK